MYFEVSRDVTADESIAAETIKWGRGSLIVLHTSNLTHSILTNDNILTFIFYTKIQVSLSSS